MLSLTECYDSAPINWLRFSESSSSCYHGKSVDVGPGLLILLCLSLVVKSHSLVANQLQTAYKHMSCVVLTLKMVLITILMELEIVGGVVAIRMFHHSL